MKASHIITELEKHADSEKAQHSYRFFKAHEGGYGEGDKFLGIRVPEQRIVARKYKELPLPEVKLMLENPYHEVRLTAGLILTYKIKRSSVVETDHIAEFYLSNISAFNNWDLIDSTCHKILGPYLEHKNRELLYELAASDDLWLNRISIITCFHFIDQHDFEDALAIAELLLNHEHDLIHKAVGWALREIGKKDQLSEERFLRKHYQKMPRTMLRYAIEKFREPLRKQYLNGEI